MGCCAGYLYNLPARREPMADLVDALLDRAYSGKIPDRLSERAAWEISRLRLACQIATRTSRKAMAEVANYRPKPPTDPVWLIYALGLVMAGAVYFLIYVFAYWGHP